MTVKGSLLPLEFWTSDICVNRMMNICKKIDPFDTSKMSVEFQKKRRVLHRLKRKKLKLDIKNGTVHIADMLETGK